MNREEAAREIDNTACCFSDKRFRDAMHMAAAALRGPQPDPDTGLVPCGCGGKAKEETRIVEISGDYIARVFCEECGIATEYYSDGNVTFLDWNRAMGRKLQ